MKKWMAALAAAVVMAAPFAADAMDSKTLLSDPARYRVIYADGRDVVYADMETLSGLQTMDYPSTIENMEFTMYVETYRRKIRLWDFEQERMVAHIRAYAAGLHANKAAGKYVLETKLTGLFTGQGEALPLEGKPHGKDHLQGEARDMYFTLSRIERQEALAQTPQPIEGDHK